MTRSRLSITLKAGAIALMACASSGAAKAETLADALVAAYKHSHLLDQNRALLRATDENVAQAVAGLRPIISFIASSNYSPTRAPGVDNLQSQLGIDASLLLYDNGATQLAVDVAKETVLSTREALVSLEQNILFGAVTAYLDVVSAAEFVQLRGNNVRLLTQELRAAQDRFEVGDVTRTDVALAEARFAAARSGEAAALGTLAVARESYRAAIGRYPGQLAAVPQVPRIPRTLKEAEALAVRTHPDIRQAQRNVTIADLNIARAEAAMKFTVNASSQFRLDQDGNDTFSTGVQLTQPIYRGGALTSALRQAKANRDAQRAALLNTTHLVRQSVGNAWANVAVTQAQLTSTDRQIRASQIAFRGFQEEAKLGSRTTLEVLDAEQELLDARTNRVDAQSQQYVAIYSLLSAMGLLTAEHLGLGVQTYDPAAYYNAVKSAPVPSSKRGKQLDKVLKRLGQN
jgi:outer membrane protein